MRWVSARVAPLCCQHGRSVEVRVLAPSAHSSLQFQRPRFEDLRTIPTLYRNAIARLRLPRADAAAAGDKAALTGLGAAPDRGTATTTHVPQPSPQSALLPNLPLRAHLS